MMQEIGELIATLMGVGSVVLVVRVAWIMAEPVAMRVTQWAAKGDMEWHIGTAKGRPALRYVTDGWGRVVYAELDPDAQSDKEGEG